MTGWTESMLRAAASWKAFKEGKSLFDRGVVVDASADANGWRGTVRSGKGVIRVGVKAKSATDLETRCPCPENRATGELCCHAVAVALAALAGPQTDSPAAAKAKSPQAAPAIARDILLPQTWQESLSRGKLTVALSISPESELHPADLKLADWLTQQGASTATSLNLHLDGSRVAGFLASLAGHPRVASGKDRSPVWISTGHRLPLTKADPENGHITLVADSDTCLWCEISGTFWQINPEAISAAGDGKMPASLEAILPSLAAGRTLNIPANLLLENLDVWQDWIAFPENGWLDSLHFVPATATFHLTLDGSLQNLNAKLTVTYGDSPAVMPGCGKVTNLPSLTGNQCQVRDFQQEQRAVQRLEIAGFEYSDASSGTMELRGETSIIAFLTQTQHKLPNHWIITHSNRLVSCRNTISIVSPQIEILGSGTDWLSFDLTFQTNDGNKISRDEVHKLLRSGKPSGSLIKGRRLIISDEVASVIEPLFEELNLQQKSGHYEASACAGEVVLEISNKLRKSKILSGLDHLSIEINPPTLRADLRPYQSRGVSWLFDRVERFGGALLADDMGLGKTIQTIALIERLLPINQGDSGVVLVVATASLLGNWRAEFARFAPDRRVWILHGSGRDEVREQITHGDVVITSYGTVTRDLAWHLRHNYRAIVVDEASQMRNPDTDHARALAKLHSTRRIALTGTPIENGVRDLWSVFRFIQPGWLGSREEFRERYEMPLKGGDTSVLERLKLKIHPLLLRRTKEQVAPELPTKLLIDEFCDLSPDQQTIYRDLLVEGRKQVDTISDSGNSGAARMMMLTALLRLRQTCCDLALLANDRLNQLLIPRRSAKLQRLLELLEESIEGNHRVLVFSQFQKQLLEIEKCIKDKNWDCLRLDGQTRNRQQMVEKFQSPDGPPVFLISLKAGGYGLNLTAADTVIHFDPWWNPATEAQATDRAHRIGQTRPVTVYRLLTRGTVEEKVVRLQAKKREFATTLDESGAGDAPGWNLEDLKSLISGS